jgi:cytochrome c oxidase subunit 3
MAVFIFTEVMLFTGLISAFMIARASFLEGMWPPPGQPRLPVEATLINTAALLISGVMLFLAYRALTRRGHRAAVLPMGVAILLGAFFVGFQGVEWIRLIGEGLTMTSSQFGAFFYLVVGAHALHATGALIALVIYWFVLRRGKLAPTTFAAVSLFWYFVVLMWPIIYWQVYL